MGLLKKRTGAGKENAVNVGAPAAGSVALKPAVLQQKEQKQQQPAQQKIERRKPSAAPLTPVRGAASTSIAPAIADDRVVLEDWSFAFNASRPLQLTGRIFNNGSGCTGVTGTHTHTTRDRSAPHL